MEDAHKVLYDLVLQVKREGDSMIRYRFDDCYPDQMWCVCCGAMIEDDSDRFPSVEQFKHADNCAWKNALDYFGK